MPELHLARGLCQRRLPNSTVMCRVCQFSRNLFSRCAFGGVKCKPRSYLNCTFLPERNFASRGEAKYYFYRFELDSKYINKFTLINSVVQSEPVRWWWTVWLDLREPPANQCKKLTNKKRMRANALTLTMMEICSSKPPSVFQDHVFQLVLVVQ